MSNDELCKVPRRGPVRRTFLWLVGCFGGALVLLSVIAYLRIGPRYQTFRQIRILGGEVMTAEDSPKWLRSVAGADVAQCLEPASYLRVSPESIGVAAENLASFRDVKLLAIDGPDVPPSEVSRLYDLENVRVLDVSCGSDASLTGVEKLSRLETLEIVDSPDVTDPSISRIARLSSLKFLVLTKTRITDAGLSLLAPMKSLKGLRIVGAPITGSGFRQLADLSSIENLDLFNSAINDAGLADATALAGVKSLDVSQTRVSDVGLESLARLPRLASLDLSLNKITDAGLQRLQNLAALRSVDLNQTAVTWKGMHGLIAHSSLTVIACDKIKNDEIRSLFDALRTSGVRRKFTLRRGPTDFVFKP